MEDEHQLRAIAHLGISTANLLGGDPITARTHAELARDLFEQAGSSHHVDLALLNLAQADLYSGRVDEAVARLLEVRPRLADSPPDAARIHEFLGDAFFRLNLVEEARQAYRDALGHRILREMPLNRANCLFGLASSLADSESGRLFRLAAKGYREVQNSGWEMAAAGRAALAGGNFAGVRRAHERLRSSKAGFLSEELGLLAAEAGAIPLPPKPRSAPLEWRHAWLTARRKRSLASYGKAFDLIERDRLAVSTPSAALRFFDDRGRVVAEYIDLLLQAGKVERALDVVARTRSAALANEIAAAHGEKLSHEALAELDRFRAEFTGGASPGARLRSTAGSVPARAWLEKTWSSKRVGMVTYAHSSNACDTWVEVEEGFCRIRESDLYRPAIQACQLKGKLDWLEFHLFEPMLDRGASLDGSCAWIRELRTALGNAGNAISPEGILWRVPWTLLAEEEVSLQLSPVFPLRPVRLRPDPRVAVWIARADDLPSIGKELEVIRSVFPQAEILESREAVRDSYGLCFDLIHVAGHARINPTSPAFSYIDFADGPLFAAEISRSGVRCELAVVAACQSGVANGHQRYEPEGLVRSFLACGAQAAVGSLWPLDDEFTYHFMAELYPMLRDGEPLADSMQVARTRSRDRFPHPYFWGALATYGGYR